MTTASGVKAFRFGSDTTQQLGVNSWQIVDGRDTTSYPDRLPYSHGVLNSWKNSSTARGSRVLCDDSDHGSPRGDGQRPEPLSG